MDGCWNPWHGCRKYSEGCEHCYVYRRDGSCGRDASEVRKTSEFDLPVRRGKYGDWRAAPGVLYTCMTSDFFLPEADEWRAEAWRMIRLRRDVTFVIITKRILLARERLPSDWGGGYDNVTLCCTAENQRRADERLPEFLRFPARKKQIICEPLLGPVELRPYLASGAISRVVAGGESGPDARVCRNEWVLSLRAGCAETGTPFYFKQTGARFYKDGKVYDIPRAEQFSQARKASELWRKQFSET